MFLDSYFYIFRYCNILFIIMFLRVIFFLNCECFLGSYYILVILVVLKDLVYSKYIERDCLELNFRVLGLWKESKIDMKFIFRS